MYDLPIPVRALLGEINAALERLVECGDTWVIFSNRMGLSQEDREILRSFLGTGTVKIKLDDGAEPAEWQETSYAGVWIGAYFNRAAEPVVETIEVCWVPDVAKAQREDVIQSLRQLTEGVQSW